MPDHRLLNQRFGLDAFGRLQVNDADYVAVTGCRGNDVGVVGNPNRDLREVADVLRTVLPEQPFQQRSVHALIMLAAAALALGPRRD